MITTSQLSVCILTNEYPPNVWGGIGTTVHGLCTSLVNYTQIHIEVITRLRSANSSQDLIIDEDDYDGVKVYRVSSGELTYDLLETAVNLDQFDLIHLHGVHFAKLASHWKEKRNIPFVFSSHSNARVEAEIDRNWEVSDIQLQDLVFDKADRIIIQSNNSRKDILNDYPHVASKLEVIPNGLDLNIEKINRTTSAEPLHHQPICLYCGRFHPRKGLDVLLEAIPLIHKEMPEVQFLFIGGHSSKYAEYYRDRILKLSIQDPRYIVLDWQPIESLAMWYRKVDLVIIPSLYEPFGNAAVEALYSGKPVIASKTGGLEDIIEDGKNGVFVNPGDALSLARGVIDTISDPIKYDAYAQNAISHNRSKYLWKNLAPDYFHLYLQCINEGN